MKNLNISNLSENELIINVQKYSCNESMKELMERHSGVVHSVIHKFYKKNPNLHLLDMLDDVYLIFNDAVKTYNPNKKAKFTTWLYFRARFHCLNSNKNADKNISYEISDIDKINNNNGKFYIDSSDSKEKNKYIFSLLEQLKDKRIFNIFKLRYFDENGKNKPSWK